MVEWNSTARVIGHFVDCLDLDKLGFGRTEPNFEGRPSYDSKSLLKLYLYGYRNDLRSSRKLAKVGKRLERYPAYRELMEKESLMQISLTDADTRLMKNKNGMDVTYNVQTAEELKKKAGEKVEGSYGSEEEMKARAMEGYFVRDPERDLVYCSGGETLRKKSIKKNGATRYANKHACSRCSYREKMSQRMCISKYPFGTIKWALGATYFLLKGKQKVSGEFALMATGYNIVKAENMFTFDELMALAGA